MPRYLIERNLPDGLEIAVEDVIAHNADAGVTWLYSYVSADGLRSFDVYEAPTPEAIRKTSARNRLPLDRITEVRVLEPHPHVSTGIARISNLDGTGIDRADPHALRVRAR
jgi:hypothetical protein